MNKSFHLKKSKIKTNKKLEKKKKKKEKPHLPLPIITAATHSPSLPSSHPPIHPPPLHPTVTMTPTNSCSKFITRPLHFTSTPVLVVVHPHHHWRSTTIASTLTYHNSISPHNLVKKYHCENLKVWFGESQVPCHVLS